tara:strand:+ start:3024 stop:3224 length:201 start_codon:yes stop_codon:yes gene_type:complete
MALADLQSQYGPSNKKGQIGTGKTVDTLANEGDSNLGSAGTNSKFSSTEKNGTPNKSMDGLAKGKQ